MTTVQTWIFSDCYLKASVVLWVRMGCSKHAPNCFSPPSGSRGVMLSESVGQARKPYGNICRRSPQTRIFSIKTVVLEATDKRQMWGCPRACSAFLKAKAKARGSSPHFSTREIKDSIRDNFRWFLSWQWHQGIHILGLCCW